MKFGKKLGSLKVLNGLPRRLEDLRSSRNKNGKPTEANVGTSNQTFAINVEATGAPADTYDVVEPWLEKASNDHHPREPLASLDSSESDAYHQNAQDSDASTLPAIDEGSCQLIGDDITLDDEGTKTADSQNAFHWRLPPTHHQASKYADSEADTPHSQAIHPLETELSSGTVIVNHHTQPSLTFTASIEDYAHKAEPKNWGPLKFKKGQSVRIRPGTYAVPFKKLSESKHKYTQLGSHTRGTVHMVNRGTASSDPREFVVDEREVMYRIWIPGKVNRTIEFIFATEDDLKVFTECAACGGFATELCGGCSKVYYCSEYCLATDWKIHKADCLHKGKAHPPLGNNPNSSARSEVSVSTNSDGSKNSKQPLRREFREDGTVKITNGYQPPPEFHKGKVLIMPKCLRPLTSAEVKAPQSSYLVMRIARRQSHRLRRRIYKNRIAQPEADAPSSSKGTNETPDTIFEDDESEGVLTAGAEIPYSAGKSPLGRSSRMGYHNDTARNDSLESVSRQNGVTSDGGLFGEEDEVEPSSGKSAESVVAGGPQKGSSSERSRFHRAFFARLPNLPPIRTSHDTGKLALENADSSDSTENKNASAIIDTSEKMKTSFSEKIPKALKKKLSGKTGPASQSQQDRQRTRKGVLRPVVA